MRPPHGSSMPLGGSRSSALGLRGGLEVADGGKADRQPAGHVTQPHRRVSSSKVAISYNISQLITSLCRGEEVFWKSKEEDDLEVESCGFLPRGPAPWTPPAGEHTAGLLNRVKEGRGVDWVCAPRA